MEKLIPTFAGRAGGALSIERGCGSVTLGGVISFYVSKIAMNTDKTMKTIITANSRSLRRGLCPLLGVIALLAMPGSARAQTLYVAQDGTEKISNYNATTGAAINANLITTGLNGPKGLVLSGNNLFVANSGGDTVGVYNASTGAAINADLIPFSSGLLSTPTGLAVSDNNLFVSNTNGNQTVGEYNATTGAAINANFIPVTQGFGNPEGLALSGNTLFVADLAQFSSPINFGLGRVGAYNATTGGAINANLVTALNAPVALALSGNTLFVANSANGDLDLGSVGEYNATTGAAINANFITGLQGPDGLAVFGNTLFVATVESGLGRVGEYDATTGAAINANFITGLQSPAGLVVAPVPEPSPWSMIAMGGVALLGIMLRKKHRIA